MEQHTIPLEVQNSTTNLSETLPLSPVQTDAEREQAHVAEEPTITAAESELTALLQQEARTRRRDQWVTLAIVVVFLVSMKWMVLRLFQIPDPAVFLTNVRICLALMLGVGVGISGQIAHRSYRRKNALANALTKHRGVEQVSSIIQTLNVENTPVRNITKQVLTRLLPTLQASDANRLTEKDRAILLRQLAIAPNDIGYRDLSELFSRAAYRREVEFRVAILKALEQVGGAKELPTVSRLARGIPTMHSSALRVPAAVREAAQACLPYLQARVSEQQASAQLLRASSANALPDDTLLRPVHTTPDTLPEQLLRASEPS